MDYSWKKLHTFASIEIFLANFMNVKSTLILLLLVLFGIGSWKYYTCNIKGFCDDQATNTATEGSLDYTPIQFYKNTDSPVLKDFEHYRDSICLQSQSNIITIQGYYYSDEVNNTTAENLGIARAMKIANLLRECMDSTVKVSLKAISKNESSTSDLFSASDISLSVLPPNITNLHDVEIVTKDNISEIYFPSGSDKEIKSEKLDLFLQEVAENATDKKIYLTGHTDNTGDEATNIRLSLTRSQTIKNQLIRLGMTADNIICEGKGSSSPKLDNSTAENRALNRRVELKIN